MIELLAQLQGSVVRDLSRHHMMSKDSLKQLVDTYLHIEVIIFKFILSDIIENLVEIYVN